MKSFGRQRRNVGKMYSTHPIVSSPIVPPPSSPPPPTAFNPNETVEKDVNLKNQRLSNVGTPKDPFDAVNIMYMKTYSEKYFMKKGDAEGETIKKCGEPRQLDDAATKKYVDSRVDGRFRQVDLKPIRYLYLPSQSNGTFPSGPILTNVSLLHCFISGIKIDTVKVVMTILILGESNSTKHELSKNGNQYNINLPLSSPTYIFFELFPSNSGSVGLTLAYQSLVV